MKLLAQLNPVNNHESELGRSSSEEHSDENCRSSNKEYNLPRELKHTFKLSPIFLPAKNVRLKKNVSCYKVLSLRKFVIYQEITNTVLELSLFSPRSLTAPTNFTIFHEA